MMASSFVLFCLLFAAVDSASVARISERDLLSVYDRVARADVVKFFKDFGKWKVGGSYDKDDDSGELEGHYKSDNGEFDGKVGVDKDGRLNGGLGGNYSSKDGKTNLGGNLKFDDNGKPQGAFSFNHQW